MFGILGPNGAGKTTTLKVLAGLLEPTAGMMEIAYEPADARQTRRLLGYLPEESLLYEEMAPPLYLRFFADFYDVSRGVAADRIDETLERLDLGRRDRPLGDRFEGITRKVAIASSLVNDPEPPSMTYRPRASTR